LKLKEKELQQEQEVSASFIASAFASLQTSQFVAPLSIQNVETGEIVTGTEVSKASTNAISQTVTTPNKGSDRLPLVQDPAPHVSVTEPIPSIFPAVFDSANESTSQRALAKPELSDALSPTSFGKTTTNPTTNSPIPDQPAQFIEQVLTAEVAKIAPAKGQVLASIPSPNLDAISARDAIQPTEPAAENHVSTESTTAKASRPTFNKGITTTNDVAEENIKTNTTTVPQAARNLEISTQTFPVNSTPSEDKTSGGTFSSIDRASKTVVMPNEEVRTKDNDFLISDGTKANNSEADLIPNPVFRVQPNTDVGKTPSSLSDAIGVDRQGPDLQTLDAPVASQSTKSQSTEPSSTSEFGKDSGFAQPEIKENIHFYQTVQKDNNAASRPLPVKTTEDVPTRNTPTETDNSTIQQFDTTYRGQQSKSSTPEILLTSSFSPNTGDSEKMEKPITSQVKDEITAGALHFNSTVDEILFTPEIEPVDNQVGEPTIKQKIAVATSVGPGFVEVAPANSTVKLPNNLNTHHEVGMSSSGNHIQGQEFSIRLDRPGSQGVNTEVEQSPLGMVGKNETKYGQTDQSASIPIIINKSPLADDQAGFITNSASERTVKQSSDAQGKLDLNGTSQGSTGKVKVTADPEKMTPGTANTYKSNNTTQILNTESGDARLEAGEMTSPIVTISSSPAEKVLPISQFEIAFQGRELSKTKVAEKEVNNTLEHPSIESETVRTQDQQETVNHFKTRNDVPKIASIEPSREPISGEPVITSTGTATTKEIEPEIKASYQQNINSQPEQNLSPVATTKPEKNKTLVFGTVEKKIDVSIESSEIQEKSLTNLSSDIVVPTSPEFSEAEAGISLQTSSVAEVLEDLFNSDITSNVRPFQSMAGSTEMQNNQGQIEDEIPQTKQAVAEPSEIPGTDFEINAERIVTEPNVEEKIQSTEINLGNLGSAAKSETFETPGTSNTDKSNTTTQIIYTESGDALFEAGEVPSPIESTSSPSIRDFSNRLSTLTEDTLPNSQFESASQGMEVLQTKVVEKEGSSASAYPLTEAGSVQTSDQPETVSVFRLRNDTPGSAPTEPVRGIISGETVTTSTEAATTLEIEPEKEAANQQVIISRSDRDLSHSATTMSEQNIPLAFETVEKKINISIESSNIQEKSSTNLSSDVVLPARLEFNHREADISLRTSSVAEEELISVFTSDAKSNLRDSQSIRENTETKSNQGRAAVEIPVPEQVVAEPSEVPASGFEINMGAIHLEPNSKQKAQGSKTILGHLGVDAKSETPETTDVSAATVSRDLLQEEKFASQALDLEYERPADLRRDVLSKTDLALGSENVAKEVLTGRESSISADARIETSYETKNQSGSVITQTETEVIEKTDIESQSGMPGNNARMLHLDMRISADDELSKMIAEENIQPQTVRNGKNVETMPPTFDEASFQSGVVKLDESKIKETEIHSELRMDRSVQNGTVPFHENENNTDIEVKPTDFNTPVGKPDEMAATHKASKNDAIPVTNQAPKVVEIGKDPIASALPKAHPVKDSHDIQKTNQIENDEKALPFEKQPGLNQTPGIPAPANGPVKETTAIHPGENVPLNQLHGDIQEVVDHVIRHINSNVKNRPTSMRLQLSPRELGAIDVQMVSDSQGVHVTFFAEQASTGKLLETQLDQLRVSLVDSGVHLSGLDIGQRNQYGQKGGSFEQSPNFTRDISRNIPEAPAGSQEKPSLERRIGRSSDIDYLI
jgi:hypothetical protein